MRYRFTDGRKNDEPYDTFAHTREVFPGKLFLLLTKIPNLRTDPALAR